jgi:hypothetical protein
VAVVWLVLDGCYVLDADLIAVVEIADCGWGGLGKAVSGCNGDEG